MQSCRRVTWRPTLRIAAAFELALPVIAADAEFLSHKPHRGDAAAHARARRLHRLEGLPMFINRRRLTTARPRVVLPDVAASAGQELPSLFVSRASGWREVGPQWLASESAKAGIFGMLAVLDLHRSPGDEFRCWIVRSRLVGATSNGQVSDKLVYRPQTIVRWARGGRCSSSGRKGGACRVAAKKERPASLQRRSLYRVST